MNDQNLKPVASRTPEARRELSRRAGRASGRRRRELKTAREALRSLLALPLDDTKVTQRELIEWLKHNHVKEAEQTQLLGMMAVLQKRAFAGDVRAIETVLKISGDWPADKQEITTTETEPEVQYRFIDLTPEEGSRLSCEFFDAQRKDREEAEEAHKRQLEREEERERRREERVKRIAMYKAGIFPDDEKKEPSTP